MVNTKKQMSYNVFLFFLFGIIIFSCKTNNNSPEVLTSNKLASEFYSKLDVANLNLSYSGILNENRIIINLNIIENDSINAYLYNYQDEASDYNIISFKGIKKNNDIVLKSNNSTILRGTIEGNIFLGELSVENKTHKLTLNQNLNYSNGNVYLIDGENRKKISLAGFRDNDICQGELTLIGNFIKGDSKYYLFNFTYPSMGFYKSKGNCGNGQESMIALIEVKKQDIYNPSININELNSCYNGIESVINDQKFNGYQLKKIWEKENSLRIKKTNLRQDSSTIVKINSELKKVIEEYEY